jgi:hypothetical protein
MYEKPISNFLLFFIHLFSLVLTTKSVEMKKLPKTKIIFLIDGIPHYVRG